VNSDSAFETALVDLREGSFSKLDPLFEHGKIVEWCEAGRFRNHPAELAEALTCACFNGRIAVAEYLLNLGVDVSGGSGTGLNALHWAANRGQLEAVRLLLRHKASLKTRSMYGGNALETALWSLENEQRGEQQKIIEELRKAGAHADGISQSD
jgi:ankyrin repeat protein